MDNLVGLIFLVGALICALIACFFPPVAPPPAWRRPHFGWLAIALYIASILAGLKHG